MDGMFAGVIRSTQTLESPLRNMTRFVVLALVLACGVREVRAQANGDSAAAIAVADSVLAALTSGDGATLARLIVDSAVVGGAAARDGVERHWLQSWGPYIKRTSSTFTERGFDPSARVQDRVALVWMPYDLYQTGQWSHCGVDVFTLMKSEGHWRVAAVIYTVEQPPACRKHPAGPPGP
jgi:hypothetical protein